MCLRVSGLPYSTSRCFIYTQRVYAIDVTLTLIPDVRPPADGVFARVLQVGGSDVPAFREYPADPDEEPEDATAPAPLPPQAADAGHSIPQQPPAEAAPPESAPPPPASPASRPPPPFWPAHEPTPYVELSLGASLLNQPELAVNGTTVRGRYAPGYRYGLGVGYSDFKFLAGAYGMVEKLREPTDWDPAANGSLTGEAIHVGIKAMYLIKRPPQEPNVYVGGFIERMTHQTFDSSRFIPFVRSRTIVIGGLIKYRSPWNSPFLEARIGIGLEQNLIELPEYKPIGPGNGPLLILEVDLSAMVGY